MTWACFRDSRDAHVRLGLHCSSHALSYRSESADGPLTEDMAPTTFGGYQDWAISGIISTTSRHAQDMPRRGRVEGVDGVR